VSVPVAQWLGDRLCEPRPYDSSDDPELAPDTRWPIAAWGEGGAAHRADVSSWPRQEPREPLAAFLDYPAQPLSERATAGFLSRTRRSQLRFPDGFIADLERHLDRVSAEPVAV
jgi:DNA (cytosine-5)-methyltransferase 1